MEKHKIMLHKISQVQKVKSHVFLQMWKLDLQVKCIYKHIYDHIHTYISIDTDINTVK
jgi:hypothetical protein